MEPHCCAMSHVTLPELCTSERVEFTRVRCSLFQRNNNLRARVLLSLGRSTSCSDLHPPVV